MGGLATMFESIVERNDEALCYYKRGFSSLRNEEQNNLRERQNFITYNRSPEKSASDKQANRIRYANYLLKNREALRLRIGFLQSIQGLESNVVHNAAEVVQSRTRQIYEENQKTFEDMEMGSLNLQVPRNTAQDRIQAKQTAILHVLERALDGINKAGYVTANEMIPIREDFDALISWFTDGSGFPGIPEPTDLIDKQISEFFSTMFRGEIVQCRQCGAWTNDYCRHCLYCGHIN